MNLQRKRATPEARRLQVAIRAMVRRFSVAERADVSCCGMTVAQAAALEALGAGNRLRSGELGRRLGISPSTTSRNLARLEERGLVERIRDPEDGRASRVRLTRRGVEAGIEVTEYENGFAHAVLDELPAERRRPVLKSLEELLAAIRRATETCCPGAFDHVVERPASNDCCERSD